MEEGRLFREEMERAGYYSFFAFVEQFRTALKTYIDDEAEFTLEQVRRGRLLFPNPERFSPSWEKLWDEFEALCLAKNETLSSIPLSERDGEWQVLIDNPYLPEQVVCYPALPFGEASYMYAYFQRELKPNENLRLQKITQLLCRNGVAR